MITIRSIVDIVAARFSVSHSEIIGPRRVVELVAPRHVAMFLARQEGHSLTKIGFHLRRDHTTVLYGAQKIERQAVADPETRLLLLSFSNDLNQLRAKIAQSRRDKAAAIIKFETENARGAFLPPQPAPRAAPRSALDRGAPPSQRRAPARHLRRTPTTVAAGQATISGAINDQ